MMLEVPMLGQCCRIVIIVAKAGFRILYLAFLHIWRLLTAVPMGCFQSLRDSGKATPGKKKDSSECDLCKDLMQQMEIVLVDKDSWTKTALRLEGDVKEWKQKYKALEKRSNEITKEMALKLEAHGDMENINDEFSNYNLGKRFESLYNKQWADVAEWLYESKDKDPELRRIRFLTTLMEDAYKRCVDIADTQLRKFLFLDDGEDTDVFKEDTELYKVRKRQGQTKAIRTKIKRTVTEGILSCENGYSDYLNIKDAKEKLSAFLVDYVDLCWLMTISLPRVVLKFDVRKKLYEGKLKEKYKQYSCEEKVTDEQQQKGTVIEIVWPCVELQDGSLVYAKGDVITVEECLKQ